MLLQKTIRLIYSLLKMALYDYGTYIMVYLYYDYGTYTLV